MSAEIPVAMVDFRYGEAGPSKAVGFGRWTYGWFRFHTEAHFNADLGGEQIELPTLLDGAMLLRALALHSPCSLCRRAVDVSASTQVGLARCPTGSPRRRTRAASQATRWHSSRGLSSAADGAE